MKQIDLTKKGAIEIHFNWIFILIAGAVIFVFFMNIVNKQREFSEIKTSGTIITNLESILTGAQVSTATVNVIDMPKVDVGFECDRLFIGKVPKQTKGNVIFSPSLLKGKKLIAWALDWNLPYRITNFLYLTDPQLRYVIVYDNDTEDLADYIDKKLPKEMNKEKIREDRLKDDFKDKNNYKVKFIFLKNLKTDPLSTLSYMPNEDVTAIHLIGLTNENIIPSTGKIKFYQKNGNTGWEVQEGSTGEETYYLKEESLFGAIFTSDIETYNCVMRKAFKKLDLVSKIYKYRSGKLAEKYAETNCAAQHVTTRLDNMISDSGTQITDFPTGIDKINTIQTNAQGLKEQNNRAQLFSCALIY